MGKQCDSQQTCPLRTLGDRNVSLYTSLFFLTGSSFFSQYQSLCSTAVLIIYLTFWLGTKLPHTVPQIRAVTQQHESNGASEFSAWQQVTVSRVILWCLIGLQVTQGFACFAGGIPVPLKNSGVRRKQFLSWESESLVWVSV